MMEELISTGWQIASIGQVTLPIEKTDPSTNPNQMIDYLDISGIDNKTNRIVEAKHYLGKDAPSRARQLIKQEDVLFSTVRTYLKNIAMVPVEYDGQVASTGFSILRAAKGISSKFLFYYTLTQDFLNPLTELQRGSSYPAVRDDDVRIQKIPIAPYNEQIRIVAKIDELFSELDKGIESLKTASEQLKIYRQVILKYAFEGKLTSVWRDKNKDRLETADQLLERIKKERRAKWEADLREKGKGPAKVKYVEPKAQEVEGLPELPKGWVWISLEMMASTNKHSISSGPFGSALGTKDYISNGIPVIRGQNIGNGAFLASEFVFISEAKAAQLIRSFTYPDDLIVVAVGSSGKAAILPSFVERGILSQNCNKITLDKSLVLPKFVEFAMQTDIALNQLKNKTTDTVRQFLSLTNLKQTVIPLLPLTEQEQIVAEVERRFSIIAELEGLIEASLKRAEKLRQSILREAFAGRLVSQDPNDEPASVLLERIRFEKTTTQTNNKNNHQYEIKPVNKYVQDPLFQETAV